jgi:hypothetical protein
VGGWGQRKDVQTDPGYHFQVGRLVGAAELTAAVIKTGKLSADELHDVGDRLHLVASWFLEPKTEIHFPDPSERSP